jgi:acetyl esterase/lipase
MVKKKVLGFEETTPCLYYIHGGGFVFGNSF